MVQEYVLHDRTVDIGVTMDEHVAKARHRAQRRNLGRIDPAITREQDEQLLVGLGLAETPIGDDMRRDVECGLNRELERMFDESCLTNVVLDQINARERPQLANTRLDERELLREERFVRHEARR